MKKGILTLFILFVYNLSFSQTINQFDKEGKRHGIWKKTFEGTNILRYEGAFSHGKEIGLFKFYKNIRKKAVLTASKQFNENDNKAYVKFFSSRGKLISEGQMDGKSYVGEWKYYQKTSENLLTLEHYNDKGNLEGERLVYYPNGQIAEKQNYINGELNGVSIWYSVNNVVLKEFIYVNGELHGISKIYNSKGELIVEGQYKQGKKHGIWKYYEGGTIVEEKDFTPKGKFKKKN
ncbi:toxin-antitoxin system YwqK family antitoxin [Flavivirga aquimarina]|uniref:Toxin-antitoxin system YwqK family antitoxin n=1 Tax=Flavivirga aquimarina TaxID=2027862 RepID=A0ABT8W6U2_9FLAO|nr:toxin-antitoxin system YwqK family antitoxin [Flavivirga aquimarina]MDO5968821.1 toxin-antitoxin system YwqK family antitoxin [Flavivirga aquimarina]